MKLGLRSGKHSTTTAAEAVDTTGAKSVDDGEARLPGIRKYMATVKSELSELPGEHHDEAGLSWPTVNVTTSASFSAVSTWIMQLVQRKTRAERQGKHKVVLKLEKEIATAMASQRKKKSEVLRNRFEDRWREVARQTLQTWHRNALRGSYSSGH